MANDQDPVVSAKLIVQELSFTAWVKIVDHGLGELVKRPDKSVGWARDCLVAQLREYADRHDAPQLMDMADLAVSDPEKAQVMFREWVNQVK